jgi:hypothetical protein
VAVLVSLASQSFGPQTRDLSFTVDVNATLIRVTFTHGDWPSGGPILRIDLLWNGISAGQFQTSGGPVRDKNGNPTGGTVVTTLQTAKPTGITSGTARIEVLQTFTSAIVVESF